MFACSGGGTENEFLISSHAVFQTHSAGCEFSCKFFNPLHLAIGTCSLELNIKCIDIKILHKYFPYP